MRALSRALLACACCLLVVLVLTRQQATRPAMRRASMVAEATPVQARPVLAGAAAAAAVAAAPAAPEPSRAPEESPDGGAGDADAGDAAKPMAPMKMFKRRRKGDEPATEEAVRELPGGNEVMQLEDKSNKPAASSDERDSSQQQQQQQQQLQQQQFDSSLVRELADLIMNNEPEMIRRKLASAQISGQLAEETRRLTRAGLSVSPRAEPTAAAAEADALANRPPGAPLTEISIMDEWEKGEEDDDVADGDDDDDDDDSEDVEEVDDDRDQDHDGEGDEQDENRVDNEHEMSARATTAQDKRPPGGAHLMTGSSTTTKKRRHSMPQLDESSSMRADGKAAAGRGSFFASPWDWVVSSLGGTKALAPQQQQLQPQGVDDESAGSPEPTSSSSSSSPAGEDGQTANTAEAGSSIQQQQQQQLADEREITVTCPPDYDESAMMENVNLSEVLMSGGNLSAEQRQQLSADLANMLGGNASQGAADQNGGGSSSVAAPTGGHVVGPYTQQHNHVGQGACIPQSARMIEVITKVVTPILFAIIVGVGLIGNIIVIAVIWDEKKQERGEFNATNLLILDLSIADLSFIIFCIPFTGWDYAVGHWVFGLFWCKANQYLIVVCALSSIYTLVLMSCDRYMAIMYPIECINYRNSANMIKAIYVKWAVILMCALPTIEMHGLVESPMGLELKSCRFLSDYYNPLKFQVIFFISSYFLPLMLIFFLYLGLLRSLWCNTTRNTTLRGHKESQKTLGNKRRITRMVASIVIVFASCWCPIQVMLILMRLKSFSITPTYVAIQVFAHTLGYMNSCVNPFIYAFTADCFYKSFKRSRFGRVCLSWFCCCRRLGSRRSGSDSRPRSLTTTNNQNQNQNHHNGINNSFLRPQNNATTTNVVVHSTSSSTSGAQCQHQPGSRRSLQLPASVAGPTHNPNSLREYGGGGGGDSAEIDVSYRRNNSSGDILRVSETVARAGGPTTVLAPNIPEGDPRSQPDRRQRLPHTVEPNTVEKTVVGRDDPMTTSHEPSKVTATSGSHTGQAQQTQKQQQQAQIASSSSANQLTQNQQILAAEHRQNQNQKTASSNDPGLDLSGENQCRVAGEAR